MNDLSRQQKRILFLLSLAILLGAGSLLYRRLNRGPVEILEVQMVTAPWPGTPLEDKLVVHVCGAVVKPGIYHLPFGSRVYQALEAAGGALPEAHTDYLNLASFLKDGERIYISPAQEMATQAPAIPAAPVSAQGEQESPVVFSRNGRLIDPNRASSRELETIPGIGPVLAARIIEYRETVGGFEHPEDLLNVSGIGSKTLARIKEHLEFPQR